MKIEHVDNPSRQKKSRFAHPTKRTLVVSILSLIVGNFIVTLLLTDFFKNGVLHKSYIPIYVMTLLLPMMLLANFTKNYFMNKSTQELE